MRHDDERKRGMAHRLWWLAAMTSAVVGLGIVLEPAETPASQPVPAAHVAQDAPRNAPGG